MQPTTTADMLAVYLRYGTLWCAQVSSEAHLLRAERVAAAHDTEETATIKEDPMIKSTCK